MTRNERAFLDMLAWSEGTDRPSQKSYNQGYDVVVGGKLLMCDYRDHPRVVVRLNAKLASSAAGRYQILARYFDAYKKLLKLPDFSPPSQDAIALQMIQEQKALTAVNIGDLKMAVERCANIWASLPGAGYGQHENTFNSLMVKYMGFGGRIGSA